nr:hypothetical protein CFP56_55004 [Quercus suber]
MIVKGVYPLPVEIQSGFPCLHSMLTTPPRGILVVQLGTSALHRVDYSRHGISKPGIKAAELPTSASPPFFSSPSMQYDPVADLPALVTVLTTRARGPVGSKQQ